jgi:predicted amidohydrolase
LFAAVALPIGLVVWRLFAAPNVPASMITPRLIEFLRTAPATDPALLGTRLRVAVASLASSQDKEMNVRQIEDIARRAKLQYRDLRLVVFGESSLGLYHDPTDPVGAQRRVAESIPGPVSERLARLAGQLGIYLAYGAVESADDTLYNSMVVLAPTGQIVAKHRKMLLHYLDEAGGITEAAANSQTFEIDGVRFGLSICADANSRWLVEQYRRQHIDVLLYSVTSKVPSVSIWLRYWPYSKVYGAWILAANRYGSEGKESYPGTVFVSSPTGHIQAIADLRADFLAAEVGK